MNHFRCAHCGGESSVTDTRERTIAKETVLNRYRRCDACGRRWATVEITRDHFTAMKQDASDLAAVCGVLRRSAKVAPAIRALIAPAKREET